MIKLAPSILTADFSNLENEVKKIELNGCKYLHLDVMDGHFVPNISFGPALIKSIRKISNMIFDVHLMISNPLDYIEDFVNAGADIINFHIECNNDTLEVINKIKSFNKKVGVTIKPNTNVEDVFPFLEKIDMVLIMSVEPGFGGQSFMEDMMEKVSTLKQYTKEKNIEIDIEVDGGINIKNAHIPINSGANMIVVGSGIYNENGADKNVISYLEYFNELSK